MLGLKRKQLCAIFNQLEVVGRGSETQFQVGCESKLFTVFEARLLKCLISYLKLQPFSNIPFHL